MIKAAIFDIDNTMYSFLDCDKVASKKIADYIEDNFAIKPEVSLEVIESLKAQQKARIGHDIGAIHSRVIRFQMFLEKMNLPICPHTAILTRMYWDCMLEQMKLEEGMEDFIKDLKGKGVKIGVCTDMTALIQYDKIEKLGLSQYIDFLVSSEESGAEKPKGRMFDLVMKKINEISKERIYPQECIFIGDSIKKDVKGPSDYGMNGLWYSKYTKDKEIKSRFFKDNNLKIAKYSLNDAMSEINSKLKKVDELNNMGENIIMEIESFK